MSSGKTNQACESDSNSDFFNSMARLATSIDEFPKKRLKQLNVDLGTSDTLVPSGSRLQNPMTSTLVVRTADNTKIKANFRGQLPLNIKGFPNITAHQVPGLAEPLLSVSDVTYQNTAVIFLKDSVLFSTKPTKVKKFA